MRKVYLSATLFLCLSVLTRPLFANVYYVAPTGSDTNPGTITQPFLTITAAQNAVVAGDTVYIRGGTYAMTTSQVSTYYSIWAYIFYLTKSGTSGHRINYWAYPGERPVFDMSAINPAGYRITAFQVNASWIYLKGLEVTGVQVNITTHTQSECFENQGSNNIYEQLSMHDGKAIGFYLTKGGNNLILNCDAYNNWDDVSEDKLGGNVDGFGCHPNKQGVGYTGNVFRGCRAWFNSDDGYDLINAFEAVTIENCWSFYNGYSTSFASLHDGNGFKGGGFGVSTTPTVPAVIPRHTIRFCVAVRNRTSGFYANHHLNGNDWFNNAAYMNAVNYNMLNRSADYTTDVPGYNHNLKNNLGFGARSSEVANLDTVLSNADTNYFNLPVTINSADFISIDMSLLTAPRQADGSLPVNNFMRLVATSDAIDAGENIGFPYYGAAPDLGAFESNYAASSLPLSLLSFTATTNGANALLNWEAASQVQNAGWDIERSEGQGDGGTPWHKIGFVQGDNVVDAIKYRFADNNLVTGTYQYRLKQLDQNGHYTYSRVVTVAINNSRAGLTIYPNPVTSSSVVQYVLPQDARVQVSVYTTDGRLVSVLSDRQQNAGSQIVKLPGEYLKTKGTYILRLQYNNTIQTVSFVN